MNRPVKFLPVESFQETLHASLCGAATLKMLLQYWNLPGKEKNDRELGDEMGVHPQLGISNEMFVDYLSRAGLRAEVKYQASFEDIALWLGKEIPVVVDWFSPGRKDKDDGEMADGHYSIVVGLDNMHIYLQDPETGNMRTIKRDDFWRVWFDFKQHSVTTWDEMVIRWMAAVYPISVTK